MTDSLTSDIAPRPDDNPIRSAFGPAGQADTVLQEHDATFRALFENIDEAFALCELVRDDAGRPVDYRILDVNHALEVASRLPRASMVGRLRSQILDTPDPEAFEYFARVVETGKPLQYDHYSIAIDRWVENLVSPQGGDRFAMLLKDITERKLADTALRASEERQTFLVGLSDALRPLRDPIELQRTACRLLGEHLGADRVHYSERHPDEGYVLVSTDYCRTGLTSMAGRYPLAAFSEIPAGLGGGNSVVVADTGDPRLLGDRASAAFRALGIRAFIAAQLICDTKVVWTLSVAATSLREWLPDEVALVEKVLENTWDAVERARAEAALRESEERLRLAAAATGLIMFDWDLTTDRATVNPRYREMLGLSEDEEVRGQAVLGGVVHPADRASVMTQLAAAFDPRSDGGFRLEHRAITREGERWMLAIGQVHFAGEDVDRRAVRVIGNSLDITERKQVEAALSGSEERLRLAVAATGLMTFDWDVASDRLTVNEGFGETFGLERTQTQGQQVLRNLVHPEDRDLAATHLAETFDPLSDGSYKFEHRVLTPTGERWILSIGQAYFEGEAENRHAVRLIGNAFDITERARSEAVLRAERARLQAIIDTIPVGFVFFEPGGKASMANEETERIWRGRLAVNGFGDSKGYWPDTGGPLAPEDWPAAQAVLYGRTTLGLEVDIERLDGSQGTILISAAPIKGPDGTTIGAVSAIQDISERKLADLARRESEERFRAVANLVPDLLWSTPQGGHTDWYNQRWLDYTGQTLEEALAGGWGASIHPEDWPNMHAKIRVARASGEPIRQELRIRSADGSYRWALVRAAPVRDAGGVVNHWFGAASDIHDERVARDELTGRVREATADLQMLSRRLLMVQEEERRHLARELHDEIGQALTGLQLQLAAARAAASAASGSGDLRQARRGLMEAEQIVQELTVRVSELSMDLRPSALDSLGLLPALLMHVDRYQVRTGLRIDLRHEGVDRRFTQEVETAAYRAVQEALTNIVRHARATHATVRLLADDQMLALAIRDDGCGFDPTAQPDTGGLSGMRERVGLLGGTVTVEAAPGQGTLVTAELPLDAGGTGPLSTDS